MTQASIAEVCHSHTLLFGWSMGDSLFVTLGSLWETTFPRNSHAGLGNDFPPHWWDNLPHWANTSTKA